MYEGPAVAFKPQGPEGCMIRPWMRAPSVVVGLLVVFVSCYVTSTYHALGYRIRVHDSHSVKR